MPRSSPLEVRLQEYADMFAPQIRAAFLAAIQDIVDGVILKEIVDALDAGDVNGAFKATGLSDAALRPVTAVIEQAFESGGVLTAGTFPRRLSTPAGNAIFHFDVRNSRAEAWLRDESSKLVTAISDDTRTAIANALQDGMLHGQNSKQVALDIVGRIDPVTKRRSGGLVGLTRQQQSFVSNMREDLENLDLDRYLSRERRDKRFDTVVQKAVKNQEPLPEDKIQQITGRYSDNLLKLRGDTIGRTEANQSLQQSQYEAMNQAADIGALNKSATKKEWDAVASVSNPITRVRPTHAKMDGVQVGFDEAFTMPDGSKMMHPGDTSMGAPPEEIINCRCRVKWVIDWFKGVK